MQTVTVSTLKSAISHIALRLNQPLMIWGPPGCGKSEGTKQAADENDALLVDIRLSQYDSVDLRGNPVAQHERQRTVWYAPETLPFVGNDNFPDDRIILLFFDEVNSATPAVAAVAYQIINDRRCGEHVLKPNVRICAGGNREGDRGVTNRMPLPLANRFTHLEVAPDVDSVCMHFQSLGYPKELIAFLQFRKPLLTTFDPAKPDKAFATSRTWEKFAIYYMDQTMPDDIKRIACDGSVGSGPSAEFFGFLDVWQSVIPIKDIIADPHGARLPESGSMEYAVAVNISGSLTLENAAPLHTYLRRMRDEFTILAWQLATKRDESLFAAPEFMDMATEYRAIFRS